MEKQILILLLIPLFSFAQNKKDAELSSNLLDKGIDLHDTGKYYESISSLIQANEIRPLDYEYYTNELMLATYYLGKSKFGLNDFKGAITEFNKIINSNEDFFMVGKDEAIIERAKTKFYISDYYGVIYDIKSFFENYFPSKPSKYDNDRASEAYTLIGHAKAKIGDHNSAIKDYSISIDLNPRNGEAYFLRFYSYFFLESRSEACDDLRTAIELDYRPTVIIDGVRKIVSENDFDKLLTYCKD